MHANLITVICSIPSTGHKNTCEWRASAFDTAVSSFARPCMMEPRWSAHGMLDALSRSASATVCAGSGIFRLFFCHSRIWHLDAVLVSSAHICSGAGHPTICIQKLLEYFLQTKRAGRRRWIGVERWGKKEDGIIWRRCGG